MLYLLVLAEWPAFSELYGARRLSPNALMHVTATAQNNDCRFKFERGTTVSCLVKTRSQLK